MIRACGLEDGAEARYQDKGGSYIIVHYCMGIFAFWDRFGVARTT